MVSARRAWVLSFALLVGCLDVHVALLREPPLTPDAGEPDAGQDPADGGCVDFSADLGVSLNRVTVVATPAGPLVFGLEASGTRTALSAFRLGAEGRVERGSTLTGVQTSLLSSVFSKDRVLVGAYEALSPKLAEFDTGGTYRASYPVPGNGAAASGVRVSAEQDVVTVVYRTQGGTGAFAVLRGTSFLPPQTPPDVVGEVDGLIAHGRLRLLTQESSIGQDQLVSRDLALDGGGSDGEKAVLFRGPLTGRPLACREVVFFAGASGGTLRVHGVDRDGGLFVTRSATARLPRFIAGACVEDGRATVAYRPPDPSTLLLLDVSATGATNQVMQVDEVESDGDFGVAFDRDRRWLVYPSSVTHTHHLRSLCVSP